MQELRKSQKTRSELARRLARAFGLTPKQVTRIYGVELMKIGAIEPSHAGLSGGNVAPSDAAATLIACMLGHPISTVAERAIDVMRLRAWTSHGHFRPRSPNEKEILFHPERGGWKQPWAFGGGRLPALPPDHTLIDAVAAVLVECATGDVNLYRIRDREGRVSDCEIRLRISGQYPHATLSIGDQFTAKETKFFRWDGVIAPKPEGVDVLRHVEITESTFHSIAEVITMEADDDDFDV